ncbi:MAG: aminopeptidase P family protein [Dethiobacter sp.]|nr:aminopeptidase P family protein [Dethiobacter sp.]
MAITKKELDSRCMAFQEKLREQGVNGALIALNSSMYYFSGTMQCQYIFIPAIGQSFGLVRKNMERAQQEAAIPLLPLPGFSSIPELIEEIGCKLPGRLGLELDVVPAALYLRFLKLFPASELVDISVIAREVRQVKSAYELAQLEEAARQVDCMNSCVPGLLVAGMEEIELASELEAILRRLGHQGMARMRGFNQEMYYGHVLSGEAGGVASFLDSPTGGTGLHPAQPQGPGRRKITVGEPVTVDYGGIHNGYVVDQTRLFSIGPLPARLNDAFAVALEIQSAMEKLLVPGMSGDKLYMTAAGIAAKAGLQDYFMGFGDTQAKFVGHGVGLEYNEFPVLAKGSPHILAENHVVAVEPKFIFPGLGMVGIENTWQITGSSARRISITPDDHIIL